MEKWFTIKVGSSQEQPKHILKYVSKTCFTITMHQFDILSFSATNFLGLCRAMSSVRLCQVSALSDLCCIKYKPKHAKTQMFYSISCGTVLSINFGYTFVKLVEKNNFHFCSVLMCSYTQQIILRCVNVIFCHFNKFCVNMTILIFSCHF